MIGCAQIKLGSREEARDGINRTALREIKLLQELKHPNVIGLLDVFGHRSNVSLVFDFMDTDLEQIIKDNTLVLTPAHIKAYMAMTLQGLEYLHLLWILHRVRLWPETKTKALRLFFASNLNKSIPAGSQTQQFAHQQRRNPKTGRFRSGQVVRLAQPRLHSPSGHSVVQVRGSAH